MTDTPMKRTPGQDAWLRGMTSRRLSRRDMIRYAGYSVGTLSFASILAACGGDDSGDGTPQPGAGTGEMPDYSAPMGDEINFSNWELYIDKAPDPDNPGKRYSPSLRMFEEENGVTVNYDVEINSNTQFFAELLPQLQGGQDTGRDIIVITNGREFNALTAAGYVEELDPNMRPNFDANAAGFAKDPFFDPGNRFSMCWQSGVTGIGYDTTKVNGEITKADDLMNADICPPGSVGVLKDDAPDFAMIQLGIDPPTSTPEDWQEAANWLTMLRDSEPFRKAYDQGYVDDLTAGNLAATMSWSGDVLYYKFWEGYPFEFIVPEGGSLLWVDNMLIPANAANPSGALALMDFYYQPKVAQLVTEWVVYMSPVRGVQELIAAHAEEESGAYGEALKFTAESPLLWPDDAFLEDNASLGFNITTDEESEEWNSIFNPIWEG